MKGICALVHLGQEWHERYSEIMRGLNKPISLLIKGFILQAMVLAVLKMGNIELWVVSMMS